MHPFHAGADRAPFSRWTSGRLQRFGWAWEGIGPITNLPADFRPLRTLFVGDDEQRWVSLHRRALLIEAAGPDARSVVWVDVFEEWAAFAFRLRDELPVECHPQAVAALIGPWWARTDPSPGPVP